MKCPVSKSIVKIGTVVVCCVAQLLAHNPTMDKHDLKQHGAELIVPGDPDFEACVDSILGQKGNDIASGVKAISVVIRNKSAKHIVGYVVVWHFTGQNGTTSDKQVSFFQPASFTVEGKGRPFANHPASSSIPSSSERVVSTFWSLGTASNLGFIRSGAVQEQIGKFASLLEQSANVSVSLDGVFFEDGSFVGPDKTGFYETSVQTFDAVQSFKRHLAGLVEKGASESEILSWVATQEKQTTRSSSLSDVEVSTAAREFSAITLKQGFAAAVRMMQEYMYHQRPAFTKSNQ